MGTEGTEVGDNRAAQDFLRKLPGVDEHNVYHLAKAAPTLAALSRMPLAQLRKLIGEANSARLHGFLHCCGREHLPDAPSSSSKS